MSEEVSVITTQLPTYLRSLLREDCTIKLVFRKTNNPQLKQQQENGVESLESPDKSLLDLTGAPLKVDLGDDDTICSEVVFESRPASWTQEEASQQPISIVEARQYLNEHLKSEDLKQYMYCLCDGKDDLYTVVIGCGVLNSRFVRTLVYILPCCDDKHEMMNLDWMKKQHNVFEFEKKPLEIKTEIIKYYNLFGYKLQEGDWLHNTKYNGNISLEFLENYSFFKLNLSVVLGHTSSCLIKFWQELCQLQIYLNLLESGCTEWTKLNCDASLDGEEIMFLVTKILTDVTFKIRIVKDLDLENVREHGVLDKLWKTLQNCSDLGDLRNSLIYFFEKLAEATRVPHLNNQSSVVAEIADGILDGKIAVPSLTFSQGLELLIDLGLQKLKRDYVTIISSFYNISTHTVDNIWNSFAVKTVKGQETGRRYTISNKSTLVDIAHFKHKLFSLYSMHKICEFIFLCKEKVTFNNDLIDGVCQELTNELLNSNQGVCEFKHTPHLCEFSMEILASEELIRQEPVSAWSIKLESRLITTVFHFSRRPLFPPSVYDDYEACKSEGSSFYVTKLVRVCD